MLTVKPGHEVSRIANHPNIDDDDTQYIVYKQEQFNENSCAALKQFWEAELMCDIELVAQYPDQMKRVISAHKIVLAANIPYFKAMFLSGMNESTANRIHVQNVHPDSLYEMVKFAYTGYLTITPDTAQTILSAAHFLQLPSITTVAVNLMLKNLTAMNCLGMYKFAQASDVFDLQQAAFKFTTDNFVTVSKESDEFLTLKKEDLKEFVYDEQLNINQEEDVFEAIVRWMDVSPSTRSDHASELFSGVRFPLISLSYLNDVVIKSSYMNSEQCKLMFAEAIRYHHDPSSLTLLDTSKTQPRTCVVGTICLLGGLGESSEPLNSVLFYSPHNEEWRNGTKMDTHRGHVTAVMLNHELYALGGSGVDGCLASAEKYSPTYNRWVSIASMHTPRRSCAAVVAGNRLFVLGGYDGSVYLRSVESYDPDEDVWSHQLAMKHARSELAAIFFDKRLYVMGGLDSKGKHKSVERYDFLNRQWEMMASMTTARAGAGAILLGEDIYVCGGQGTDAILDSMEVYNAEEDLWEAVKAKLNVPRVGLCIAALGTQLYVMGGSNGSDYLDSTEVYSLITHEWKLTTKLPCQRFAAGAITLPHKAVKDLECTDL